MYSWREFLFAFVACPNVGFGLYALAPPFGISTNRSGRRTLPKELAITPGLLGTGSHISASFIQG
jgi:hypothetical protein